MSAVCILAPAIIGGWPAISAAVAGAAAALGMAVAKEGQEAAGEVSAAVEAANSVEVEVENSEIVGQTVQTGQQIVLVQGDIRVRIYRDERGQLRVSVSGEGRSNAELQAVGEQVVNKVSQMFVYNKVMTELKSKGFTVVAQQQGEDEAVRIHVRHRVG